MKTQQAAERHRGMGGARSGRPRERHHRPKAGGAASLHDQVRAQGYPAHGFGIGGTGSGSIEGGLLDLLLYGA